MSIRKISVFFDDHNPDTNQWPIHPTSRISAPGGAQYPIAIGAAEIELVRRENPGDGQYVADEKIQWAVRNIRGGIYFSELDGDPPPWEWPAVIMGSKSDVEYNTVLTYQSERGKTRISTIPKMADYSGVTCVLYPWWFHRVWVTNRQGCFDTPKGVFWMPLFSALGRVHPFGEYTGEWVKNEYLGSEVVSNSVFPPPPVDPPVFQPYAVIVLRRTVGRQQPRMASASMGAIFKGTHLTIHEEVNGWGYVDTRMGWVLLADVVGG